MKEALKGYRTVIFNVIMTVLAFLSIWNPGAELPGAVEVNSMLAGLEDAIIAVWGVGNIILRAITTSAIFKKE